MIWRMLEAALSTRRGPPFPSQSYSCLEWCWYPVRPFPYTCFTSTQWPCWKGLWTRTTHLELLLIGKWLGFSIWSASFTVYKQHWNIFLARLDFLKAIVKLLFVKGNEETFTVRSFSGRHVLQENFALAPKSTLKLQMSKNYKQCNWTKNKYILLFNNFFAGKKLSLSL